jgi:pimeloyl-ACP methyl ester carboxylesterase
MRRMATRVVVLALGLAGSATAQVPWPRMVASADGVPISYEVSGSGEPTLVFVHGWSCDGRYWRAQVPHFSRHHRVVTLDLAGHGHSGLGRQDYTLAAFGRDVQAVVEAVGAERVILVGHSMGGSVSAHAARLMPDRVAGIIGVDTFTTVEFVDFSRPGEEVEQTRARWREDFAAAAREFVEGMFEPDNDPQLREWVVADMAAAPPAVAMTLLSSMAEDHREGRLEALFDGLAVPVVAINTHFRPTDVEANRRQMHSFDLLLMEGADHFPHMTRPEAFNRELEGVIATLAGAPATAAE